MGSNMLHIFAMIGIDVSLSGSYPPFCQDDDDGVMLCGTWLYEITPVTSQESRVSAVHPDTLQTQ